jgi:16S rRNA (guanine1207-N2)-methyltransferase
VIPQVIAGTALATYPGIFSWDEIDQGSKLLVETLGSKPRGAVLDLGAGNGYLCVELLKSCSAISSLTLAEADARALECARINLSAATCPCTFHWVDATTESFAPAHSFDWVISNPPFHDESGLNRELGFAFVRRAIELVKPQGTLALVTQENFAFEKILHESFDRVELAAKSAGYKVLISQGKKK